MSIDSSTRSTAVPGARTPAGPPAGRSSVTGALFGATGEHIGLAPVAQALGQPPAPALPRHPVPPARRLLGLCLAAAVLGFAGIVVGVRGWFGLVMHKTESWYLLTIVILGVAGVLTAATSFLTVHRRYAPWVAASLSGLVLIAAVVVNSAGIH